MISMGHKLFLEVEKPNRVLNSTLFGFVFINLARTKPHYSMKLLYCNHIEN